MLPILATLVSKELLKKLAIAVAIAAVEAGCRSSKKSGKGKK